MFCVVSENRANGFQVKRIMLIMAKTISVTIIKYRLCSKYGAGVCVCLQWRKPEPGGAGC